jgi:hypothetical protein
MIRAGKEDRPDRVIGLADGIVILLCLAGAFFCLWFFWTDFNQTLLRLNEKPLGTITWKYRAAQRRFTDRTIWGRLRRESPVYNGDYVRTAEFSEVTITLSGGIAVALEENSLIQVFADDAVPRIDFTRGSLSVNASDAGSGTALLLNAGGNLVRAAGGTVLETRIAANGNFNVSLSEGMADITAGGKTHVLNSGQTISLDSGGVPMVEARAVMLSPKPVARVLQNTDSPQSAKQVSVEFSWNTQNYAPEDHTRLEIAADRSFKRIVRTVDGGDHDQARAELDPGAYFWRAYPVSEAETGAAERENALNAAVGKISISAVPVPLTIAPENGYEYRYRSKLPAVRFRWTGSPEIASYVLEVADNPGFVSPTLQTLVQGNPGGAAVFLAYSGLGPGRWYWRVSPAPDNEYEGFLAPSAISSFTITKDGNLNAPILLTPRADARISVTRERQEIYFSWQNEAEADSYILLISANADLRDPVITRRVTNNYYAYDPGDGPLSGEGQFYWGVYQSDGNGDISAVSLPRSFSTRTERQFLRAVYPPDNYIISAAQLQNTRFTWKANFSDPLRFQLSDTPDFSRLTIDETTAGKSFPGRPLADGRWYWRIAAGALNLQTPVRTFRVISVLQPPVLTAPRRIVIRPGVATSFDWRNVEGADYYVFSLYSGSVVGGRRVYSAPFVARNRVTVSLDRYNEGSYSWTVQAFANETAAGSRRSSPVSSAMFDLRRFSPVSLDYPPGGTQYPGLRALRDPDRVRWSSRDPAVNTRFVLSRSPDPLRGAALMEIRNPPFSIPLIRLPAGEYYWTVQAETRDGLNISAPAPAWFRVLPPALLPGARLRRPQNGYNLGPDQLREVRAITFAWDAVPGANAYILALYRDGDGGRQLIRRWEPSSQTSLTLNDLSLLERGRLIWQVEAVNRLASGSIEQRGAISERRFTVDLPLLPRQDTANDPGRLYGQ